MTRPVKILHTGDIHLDSPFSGLSPSLAETRLNELRAAFTSMMTYVRVNEVDVVLIAGDLFDSEFATRETVGLIVREAAKCRAEVSILQWTRWSPAAFSFRRSSRETSPRLAQSEMPLAARIARRASQISSTCTGVCPRPDVTIAMRPTPFASAFFASATHFSGPTKP